MTLVTGLTAAGFQSRLDDLEAAITALLDAQHTYDTAHYSPIAEPVALAATTARQNAISQEVNDRDAAILVEANARTQAINAKRPVTYLNRRTAGNTTVNVTGSWMNVNTALDLVVPAAVDDLIEVTVCGVWGLEAPTGLLDVVSIVSGNPVNSWGVGGAVVANPNTVMGVQAWYGPGSVNHVMNGSIAKRIVAGDLSGGNVTLRLRTALTSAGSKTLYASTTLPFLVQAVNYKQG